jgi:hypothetical protein
MSSVDEATADAQLVGAADADIPFLVASAVSAVLLVNVRCSFSIDE